GAGGREAPAGRGRNRIVLAAGEAQRGGVGVGLVRVAAGVVEELDVERDLTPVAVVVHGRRPRGSPAGERRLPDARLPALDEAEGGREEDEPAHRGGASGRGERRQVAAQALARERRRAPPP